MALTLCSKHRLKRNISLEGTISLGLSGQFSTILYTVVLPQKVLYTNNWQLYSTSVAAIVRVPAYQTTTASFALTSH